MMLKVNSSLHSYNYNKRLKHAHAQLTAILYYWNTFQEQV